MVSTGQDWVIYFQQSIIPKRFYSVNRKYNSTYSYTPRNIIHIDVLVYTLTKSMKIIVEINDNP